MTLMFIKENNREDPLNVKWVGMVVMSLTSTLPPIRNCKGFTDNFVTSLPIVTKLEEKEIFLCQDSL